ncbi:hypothetical protein D3C80_423710 [compost metagenome]
MRHGVSAQRNERMRREVSQFLWSHDQFAGSGKGIDAVSFRQETEVCDGFGLFASPDIAGKAERRVELLYRRLQVHRFNATPEIEADAILLTQKSAHDLPPQRLPVFGEALCDEDGEGHAMPGENGQRVFRIIAVPVIKREGCKWLG